MQLDSQRYIYRSISCRFPWSVATEWRRDLNIEISPRAVQRNCTLRFAFIYFKDIYIRTYFLSYTHKCHNQSCKPAHFKNTYNWNFWYHSYILKLANCYMWNLQMYSERYSTCVHKKVHTITTEGHTTSKVWRGTFRLLSRLKCLATRHAGVIQGCKKIANGSCGVIFIYFILNIKCTR